MYKTSTGNKLKADLTELVPAALLRLLCLLADVDDAASVLDAGRRALGLLQGELRELHYPRQAHAVHLLSEGLRLVRDGALDCIDMLEQICELPIQCRQARLELLYSHRRPNKSRQRPQVHHRLLKGGKRANGC